MDFQVVIDGSSSEDPEVLREVVSRFVHDLAGHPHVALDRVDYECGDVNVTIYPEVSS